MSLLSCANDLTVLFQKSPIFSLSHSPGLLHLIEDVLYFGYHCDLLSFFAGELMHPIEPHGQGLQEYALVILLVGIIVIVLLALFGSAVGNMFSNIIANF